MPTRVIIVLLGLLVGGSLLAGAAIGLNANRETRQSMPRQPRIASFQLGSYIERQDRPTVFEAKSRFSPKDRIALQVDWLGEDGQSLPLSVRLLDEKGRDQQLKPSSVSLAPGQTYFCCWQIAPAGEYTLQVFRPEGTLTALPLVVGGAGI